MTRIEELEKKINDLIKDLEELKGQKKEKYYKPKEGDEYWYTSAGDVDAYNWYNHKEDVEIFNSQDVYKTQEEAEFYLKKQQLLTQYKRYLLDHEEEAVDWGNNNQLKYYAYCNFIRQEVCVNDCFSCKNQGTIYTTNSDSILEFIKEIGEEDFIKYILIGEYKDE